MIFTLYKILSNLSAPFVRILVKNRLKKNLEDQTRICERFGIPTVQKPKTPVVWFHAASVGESLSVLPVIKLWQEAHPTDTILVTTVTKTSATILAKRLPKECIHQYVPFDVHCWITRFLNFWKPQNLIMVESELWPNMLQLCQKRKIPITLLNARLSDKSYALWSRYKYISKKLFEKLDFVFAQSQQDALKYLSLGAKNVTSMPHLKYAAAPLPYSKNDLDLLQNHIQKKVFVAISTHAGEEEQLFDAYKQVKETIPNILFVLIPRHIDRTEDIIKSAKDLIVCKRSEHPLPPFECDIYIADTMGEVGLFCALSHFAFVGATLVDIGGHNPLEPLMLDNIVFVGPYTKNITALMDELPNAILQKETALAIFQSIKTYVDSNGLENKHLDEIKKMMNQKRLNIESSLKNHLTRK